MADVNGPSKAAMANPEARARPTGQRLSFASVAALAASQSLDPPTMLAVESIPRPSPNGIVSGPKSAAVSEDRTESLRESVARLNIRSGPIIASTDSEDQTPISESLRFDDERTHLSSVSNPTVSTDVRSVVSGTTFAMDEKESIRPDESASVKAADEEDSNSGGASGGPQSIAGSEAGKAFRDQFHEISGAKRALPLTTNLVESMPDETGRTGASVTTMAYVCPPPDEKLIEALLSHRDRMFLLQMEQQVIAFVKNPKEQTLHLPPGNAFCRLLAHRLADYYNLAHTAEHSGSVRLGKTDGSRLPPPLSEIANQQTASVPPVAPQPALKIMRRSDKTTNSASQANSTSNANSGTQSPNADSDSVKHSSPGMDPSKDISPSKDVKRPTLEEREAKYNARREELYKDISEQSADNSNSVSRASSILSGQKGKKRQPKNDDFEPRSSFTNMGYGGTNSQQNLTFAQRQGQSPYPPQHGGQMMNPTSVTQNYSQANYSQQGFASDANKPYVAAYDPNQGQNYYAQGYQGYGSSQAGYHAYGALHPSQQPGQYQNQQSLGQQPASNAQYTAPHSGQQMQPYFMPQFDRNFAYGPGQMMYPPGFQAQQQGSAYRPSPISQYGGQAQSQFPVQIGHPIYPNPLAAPSSDTMPAYAPNQQTAMPFHPGQPGHYNAPGNPASQTMPGNAGIQSPTASYRTGKAKKGNAGNLKVSTAPGLHPNHWNNSGRSQIRDNSTVEEFVVPRQEEHAPQQIPTIALSGGVSRGESRAASGGGLIKYDTSSLPPKPPAPASPSQ